MIQNNGASPELVKIDPAIIARPPHSLDLYRAKHSVKQSICQDCRFQDLCLSRGLNEKGLEALGKAIKPSKVLKKGQHLHRQDDGFSSIYFIRSGSVKSYINNAEGHEVAVSFFLPGETIGLDGLYNKKHSSSVVALEDTFFCEMPFTELEKLVSVHPLLQWHLNELLSRQIVQEQSVTILRGQKTAADRVLVFLHSMSERYARIRLSSRSFRLPMTRKDIAGCLGLTIETVSRQFSQFQELGWIEVNGRDVKLKNLPEL